MRILQGTKTVEAPPGWRDAIERDGRPVVIDLGAGDGRYVYDSARHDPSRFYVAVEPRRRRPQPSTPTGPPASPPAVASRTSPSSSRPSSSYRRSCLGIAQIVRVNFPWGSLLRALLGPDAAMLRSLASLATPGGRFEIVFSYHPDHDTSAFAGVSLPLLDESHISNVLVPAYHLAGLDVTEQRRLTQDEALEIPSTWGRRLLHARPRDVYFVAGNVSPPR